MKDTTDTLNAVENLTEEDAKAFLKLIYANIDIFKNGNYTIEKLIEEISSFYSQKIIRTVELRNAIKEESR
ncbi:hypothetical protein [Oceanobacillus profundus]|uniref:Uncharacterized protein n=1 Tax=Oceanobacillus profundus TaxID=372463 RepID=A0A417Y9D4_9BACI|nr:hypothetical protein [Oceanobacillus profundus]MBR3121207.1 hypothetical protein [Oceanobacillus sp.]PAE27957.1 hypothetical protein CHI07_16755 [Paenibacillus sp. 7884-2]RHW29299.1 hypothetical protein D1B32_22765 [Oceanobacillus profundus]